MKKLFFGMIGWLALCVVACGNSTGQKQDEGQQVVKQEQKKRTFQLPQVPSVLVEPMQRAVYVAEHYWDHFDFCDTAYIHLPDITEQAAVNYMDLLRLVSEEVAQNSLKGLVEKASAEPLMMDYMWKTFFRYWHEPNSPLKNEDMFILFCLGVEQTPEVGLFLQERAAYYRKMAEKNRMGTVATDFVYTLANGKQGRLHGIQADYTVVFFYDPDCHTCSEIKREMRLSSVLSQLVAKGELKVLTVYPDEDVALWRTRLPEMADSWINGYDKGQVLTVEEWYDLSSIPSFYVLDKQKRVLLKDADWGQVLRFLENKSL